MRVIADVGHEKGDFPSSASTVFCMVVDLALWCSRIMAGYDWFLGVLRLDVWR